MWLPETGYQCRDGKDNNGDGQVDCHEVSCQHYRYCRKLMYEVPESPDRAPGLFVTFGAGVALPNYRTPTATTESTYARGERVPFDSDVGLIGDLEIGYLFLKWLGLGVNSKLAVTTATNESEGFEQYDDPSEYKYTGDKVSAHLGAFIRLQWPFSRVVPYVNIAGGYGYAQYEWRVYGSDTSWDEIDSDDYEGDDGNFHHRDTKRSTFRHFTFAVEPGIDLFLAKRRFAMGLKAWLPVIANQDSSTDNTGVMLTMSITPMWREAPRLKAEYEIDEAVEDEAAPAEDAAVVEPADEAEPAASETEPAVSEAEPAPDDTTSEAVVTEVPPPSSNAPYGDE